MKKSIILVFALLVGMAACGGRERVAKCDVGVTCVPPSPHEAYCCPDGYECCVRWGDAYGCCQGDVPDATPY